MRGGGGDFKDLIGSVVGELIFATRADEPARV